MFGSTRRSPRLAGWDGRRKSSRCDALFDWSALRRRGVLLRLGVVAVTTGIVAAILACDVPRVAHSVGAVLVVLLLAATISLYSSRFQPAVCGRLRAVVGIGCLIALSVGAAAVLSRPPWHAAAFPLTVAAMVLTIAYNPPFALLISLCLAIVCSLAEGPNLRPLLAHLGGLSAAVLTMRQVRTRSRPVEVGLIAGGASAVMAVAVGLITDRTASFIAAEAGRCVLWSALAGFVVAGSLPLIELCFGVVTDVTLHELADNSHPLLQELRVRAPGTFAHSLAVAQLAEAAADEIGANPLLVRVGAYFHDVGKMTKPSFFIENQSGENRHDQLEPTLSALVIVGHVKDGVALAVEYGLPDLVTDFIREHHGTTLVEYFYREAVRLHGGDRHTPEPSESSFRYPGPKPRSREAGILMVADAAESASRAIPNPTPTSLRKLVHDLVMKRLLDGQFDESGLTLSEVRGVEEVIVRNLVAVHHTRVRYDEVPQAKTA